MDHPKRRGFIQQDLPHITHSSTFIYRPDQTNRPSYMEPDFRQTQQGYARNENHTSHPYPLNIHESIRREMDKERIRQEIIMEEIARRQVLEAEVRMELMLERELAMRSGCNVLSHGLPSVMGFHSPMKQLLLGAREEGWPVEEIRGTSLEKKGKLKGRTFGGGFEPVQYQRGNADLKISEDMPFLDNNKEKERMVFITKPDEHISGSKRKAATPPVVDDDEGAHIISNKISTEELRCALCQVTATSEKALNEHLGGKKHKSKEAALKVGTSGKSYSIGLFPKKAKESIHGGKIQVEEAGVKLIELFPKKATKPVHGGKIEAEEAGVNLTSESLLLQDMANKGNPKKDESLLLQEKPKSDNKMKIKPSVAVQTGNKLKKKKCKFWCELCQVETTSLNMMNNHKKGKKHVSRLRKSERNGSAGTSDNMKKNPDDAKVGRNLESDNVEKNLDEGMSDNNELLNPVKQVDGINLELANLKKEVGELRLEDQDLLDAKHPKNSNSKNLQEVLNEIMAEHHKLMDALEQEVCRHADITEKEKDKEVNIIYKEDDGFDVDTIKVDEHGKDGVSNEEDEHKDEKHFVP